MTKIVTEELEKQWKIATVMIAILEKEFGKAPDKDRPADFGKGVVDEIRKWQSIEQRLNIAIIVATDYDKLPDKLFKQLEHV